MQYVIDCRQCQCTGPLSRSRKAQGTNLGRRRLEDSDSAKAKAIRAALAEKKGIHRIARELQTGVGTVLRIRAGLAERMRPDRR